MQMNSIFLEIKNSLIDSEIKWCKQSTKAIGRQEFYIKCYLTWSKDHLLESPGQTKLKHDNDDVPNISSLKCCYFSTDAYHDYYLQGWTKMESITVMNKPDLIHIRHGQLRIFHGDFIHCGGFNNTGSNGNFRIQLLIIDEGHKLYIVVKHQNNMIDYDTISDKDLLLYNFGEEHPNYNNRSVRNYTYSSLKNIEFCHVKKHTGVDLVLSNDC